MVDGWANGGQVDVYSSEGELFKGLGGYIVQVIKDATVLEGKAPRTHNEREMMMNLGFYGQSSGSRRGDNMGD